MTRPTILALCLILLAPAAARADDGGWLDWLWQFDTTFVGAGTDFHVLCLDAKGQVVHHGEGRALFGCEEWFIPVARLFAGKLPEHDFEVFEPDATGRAAWRRLKSFSEVKHEFDVRAGVHWSVGTMVPANHTPGDRTWLASTTILYRYHFVPKLAAEGGVGSLIIFAPNMDTASRGMLTAAIVWSTAPGVDTRFTVNVIPGRVSATDLGDTSASFSHSPEASLVLTTVIDLRKFGRYDR